MKPFFLELFEYNHFMNQQLAEKFVASCGMPEKAVKLFSHLLCAHHIWNARINVTPATLNVWDILTLSELKFTDRSNFEISGLVISNADLDAPVTYTTSKGEQFSNSTRDILFHVVNHSTYHRAQIATLMKEHGMAPLVSDYIFYKR